MMQFRSGRIKRLALPHERLEEAICIITFRIFQSGVFSYMLSAGVLDVAVEIQRPKYFLLNAATRSKFSALILIDCKMHPPSGDPTMRRVRRFVWFLLICLHNRA